MEYNSTIKMETVIKEGSSDSPSIKSNKTGDGNESQLSPSAKEGSFGYSLPLTKSTTTEDKESNNQKCIQEAKDSRKSNEAEKECSLTTELVSGSTEANPKNPPEINLYSMESKLIKRLISSESILLHVNRTIDHFSNSSSPFIVLPDNLISEDEVVVSIFFSVG